MQVNCFFEVSFFLFSMAFSIIPFHKFVTRKNRILFIPISPKFQFHGLTPWIRDGCTRYDGILWRDETCCEHGCFWKEENGKLSCKMVVHGPELELHQNWIGFKFFLDIMTLQYPSRNVRENNIPNILLMDNIHIGKPKAPIP